MNLTTISLFPSEQRRVALDATALSREGWIYRDSLDEPSSVALNQVVVISAEVEENSTRHDVLEYLVRTQQNRISLLGAKMWVKLNEGRDILCGVNPRLLHTSARFIFAAALERKMDTRRDLLAFRYNYRHRGYKWAPIAGDAVIEKGNDFFVGIEL